MKEEEKRKREDKTEAVPVLGQVHIVFAFAFLSVFVFVLILTYWKYFKTPFKSTQNSGEPCSEKGEQAEKGEIVAAARKVSADHIKSFLKKHRGNL